MTVQGLTARHMQDVAAVIQAAGQSIVVLDADGPRTVRGRWRMLTAAELANCLELYSVTVHIAAGDFPNAPPRKGLVLVVGGVRRGVMEVLFEAPSDQPAFWKLGLR